MTDILSNVFTGVLTLAAIVVLVIMVLAKDVEDDI